MSAPAKREHELTLAGLRTVAVGEPQGEGPVVILLHGFAMRPMDLAPFAHSLGLPGLFLFPEGPLDASLEPGVVSGRAWWHIDPVARTAALARGPRDFASQHPADLPAARDRVCALLDAVTELAGGRPLVLGGFSQGGMLVCDTVLRHRPAVDALVLLSASRIAFDGRQSCRSEAATEDALRGLPVFLSHGRADPDLAFSAGERLRDFLAEAGADVRWNPFDQGHEIPLVIWRGLRRFLLQRTAAAKGRTG